MDPSLQSLLGRLDRVSDKFSELREGVNKAIGIAETDPEMALTRARKVLEYVIRDVYGRRINEPPGTRPLENLLQRLVKDGFFPDRLDAYANTVRKLGNVGTHTFGETIAVADVYQSLTQLMPIIEWYFEVERPDGLNGQSAKPLVPRPVVESRLTERAPAPASHVTIVPKGLRSFDAHDADFFLDLLPGPRDKHGLPESIRFWKHRIESTGETAFTIGVLYGPSGCGKSSLVQAGLLPRLARHVLPVYVEANAVDTQARLLKGLRKTCPALPGDLDLADSIAALRQGTGLAPGQKVLLVIDQFEQWLHAHRDEQDSPLSRALRQCDAERVQCLLLVRDDFWMALSRFMGEVQIELLQGHNMTAVDLFDPIHARQVLVAFGRAFGRLDATLSKDQESFVNQVVRGLTQDGRIISVRLALFAEMVKGKPWTEATFKAVGGAEGIGSHFLEETFSAASASAEHRYHQSAAQAVLKTLLPDSGANIKGRMRPYSELLAASGYTARPKDFADLIRILDGETRLITPTDPVGTKSVDPASFPAEMDQKYYQLAHDYLVPSLRNWLTRKQKETRRGRAGLLLADRAMVWNARPENRRLPSLWQWLSIQWLTRKKTWTAPQQKMMQKAGRVQGLRAVVAALLLAALLVGGREIVGRFEAKSLVEQLVSANVVQVPDIVRRLNGYRRWADPLLKQEEAQAKEGSDQLLRLKIALLPVDTGQTDYVYRRLLDAAPDEVRVLQDALAPHKDELLKRLWWAAEQPAPDNEPQRLRAAAALAAYDPSGKRWEKVQDQVANDLVRVPAVYLAIWMDALRPVGGKLIAPLSAVFRDSSRAETERSLAADILADYAADQTHVLADLVMDADKKQFAVLYPNLKNTGESGLNFLATELNKKLSPDPTDLANELLAKRQANAAVALLKMDRPEKVWPLLKHSPDPRARSYLIDRFATFGVDPKTIIKRLDEEQDVTIQRALILSLGDFGERQLSAGERQSLTTKLQHIYRTAADPGLHAAAEWLLRSWQQEAWLKQVDQAWATDKERREKANRVASAPGAQPQWYVNGQSQTFVVIPGPVEFMMGSPPTEVGRSDDESQHKQRISRTFAIAAKPVTLEEYRRFDAGHNFTERYAPTPDCPVVSISWNQAAAYCNWLSKQEGIDAEQWCYETDSHAQVVKLRDKYLSLTGYRLPTEAEMEYATRAGALTSRYFGETEELLPKYAWYIKNSGERTWPVGSKKPNDLGLFDMHGNVWCCCQEQFKTYPSAKDDEVSEDKEVELSIEPTASRVLRGGSFNTLPSNVRSASRYSAAPTSRHSTLGFRAARTYP